jgi:pimeloyl-ACP methyl ester carboxylesterase
MAKEVHHVSVDGVRLAYEKTGAGYPSLLIHGFPRDRRLWRKVVPGLAARFTAVAMDRRGYGESDRPPDAAGYDNRTMAADALGLAHELGWKKFLLVGHDRGAPAAQRLAADYPAEIAGLVMLDCLPFGLRDERPRDPTGRGWYMDFFRQRGVAEKIIGQNPRLFFSLFLQRNSHLTPEEQEIFLEPFCRPGSVAAVLADYRHGLDDDAAYWKDWFQSGNRITTPVCALWSEKGPVARQAVLEAWRTAARDVRGAMISDCAHYLQEERPDAVVEQILRFGEELGIR